MATSFLHTSGIQARSAIFNSPQSHELYMAVLAIEWQINQHLKEPNTMKSYGPFSKGMQTVCVVIVLVFMKFIFTACFGLILT